MIPEKFTMKTPDGIAANIAALKSLFPEAVTEGKIDIDQLKTLLGEEVAGDERYQFTWAGKRAAMLEASTPTRKTLRPCVAESKDWETTKNIYIEGDNLEALKILQNTYGGNVKMIYIDPPYNTGHDFIYHDNFHGSKQAELIKEGVVDAETGERFKVNADTNGYFHSDWCSMMYPRLKLARNLLREDGVIFISIDDNEMTNARRLCDEVFGAANFVDAIIWEKRYSPQNAVQWFSESHEYVVVYAKNKLQWHPRLLGRTEEMNARYRNLDNDTRGVWKPADATAQGGHGTKGQFYVLTAPNGTTHTLPPGRCWLYTEPVMKKMIEDNRIWFGATGNNVPAVKKFLSEVKQGIACQTIWKYQEVGHSQSAKKELIDILGSVSAFDTPKPTSLLKRIVYLSSVEDDDVCLDFFSGSATTAHSVMQLNAEDGGSRKFIMVQLPEVCAEDSEAAKAGYKNICEIGKERIRRAGEKIKEENATTAPNLDVGFRVFKVDSSNMDDIYFQPREVQQEDMIRAINNVKSDRDALDLLFGCLLEWGLPIDLPVKARTDLGNDTYDVDDGHIIACFDTNVGDAIVKAIANEQPRFAIFRDLSFVNSAAKINVGEIFKALSPKTQVKVL